MGKIEKEWARSKNRSEGARELWSTDLHKCPDNPRESLSSRDFYTFKQRAFKSRQPVALSCSSTVLQAFWWHSLWRVKPYNNKPICWGARNARLLWHLKKDYLPLIFVTRCRAQSSEPRASPFPGSLQGGWGSNLEAQTTQGQTWKQG